MPQMPQTPDDPIVEALRQRGLLATGGNIRMIPFGNADGAATVPSPDVQNGSGITDNGDGTVTTTDIAGNPVTFNPKAIDPKNAPNLSPEQWNWLAPLIAGASGALIGEALGRRRNGRVQQIVEPADPLAPLPEEIVEGEFAEVPQQKQLSGPRNQTTFDKIGPGEAAQPLPKPQVKLPQGETAKSIAARKLQKAPVTEQSRVSLPDEFTDMTEEEYKTARALAEKMVMARQGGNVRSFNPNAKGVGPQHKPTSPGRATERVDDMIGNVVRVLRDQKALKSLSKVK